jgi:hypothetical protein
MKGECVNKPSKDSAVQHRRKEELDCFIPIEGELSIS